MPRRRRRTRRPRRRRRFRGRRRGLTTRQAAFRALSRVDPEKKVFDTILTSQPLQSNPTFILLNGIGEGSAINERIGRSCKILSVQWKMWCTSNTDATFPMIIRVSCVIDKQCNGAQFGLDDYLNQVALPTVASLNLNNNRRFKTLSNQIIRLDPSSFLMAHREKYIRMRLHPRYDAAGSNIDSIATGSIYLVIMVTTDVANQAPTIVTDCRTRFVG